MYVPKDQKNDNVVALNASIQKLVSQFLSNRNITDATASIKEAIEAAATSNTAAPGAITTSSSDAAASAKITADAATAHPRPTVTMSLYPGAYAADDIIYYCIPLPLGTSSMPRPS